ncbi:MAG: hypothetical protein ACRYG8_08765, partial [Janthinobacterium lividum]
GIDGLQVHGAVLSVGFCRPFLPDDPSQSRSAVLPTPLRASAPALRSARPARGLREARGRGGAGGDGAKR